MFIRNCYKLVQKQYHNNLKYTLTEEAYLEPSPTFMERFEKIVNWFQLLFIFAKSFMLDVGLGSEYAPPLFPSLSVLYHTIVSYIIYKYFSRFSHFTVI